MLFKFRCNVKNHFCHTSGTKLINPRRCFSFCDDICLSNQSSHMLNDALSAHTELFGYKIY